jgi:hypothetical protein
MPVCGFAVVIKVAKAPSAFSFSLCFSSLRPSDHGGHDGHQLVGFLFDGLGVVDRDKQAVKAWKVGGEKTGRMVSSG